MSVPDRATVPTVKHHYCNALNECKQKEGGCGIKLVDSKGVQVDCKQHADSGIPLFDGIWEEARKKFEAKHE